MQEYNVQYGVRVIEDLAGTAFDLATDGDPNKQPDRNHFKAQLMAEIARRIKQRALGLNGEFEND